MICLTCRKREARIDKHDCDRCLPILTRLNAYAPDTVREWARAELFPGRLSDAEVFATEVDAPWHFTEIADAIRKRRVLWGEGGAVLLTLPGVEALLPEQLLLLAEDLGAHVERGTIPGTLYIVGL